MSYFTWGSFNSADKNVIVDEYAPVIRPKRVEKTVTIPGRSGDIVIDEDAAYEPYVKEVVCWALPEATLSDIASWLKGSGAVVFGNEPTYKYTARIVDEIVFQKVSRAHEDRKFTVRFLVQPWKELATAPEDQTITVDPTNVTNSGTLESFPVMVVTGSGDVTIYVGTLYSFTLSGMAGGTPLRLDSEAGIVTDTDILVNYTDKMSGQFPRLDPGINAVTWDGTVTSIVVTKNERWI